MKLEIYTSPTCGFCFRAKKLLEQKNLSFIEYDIFLEPSKRDEMISRTGGKTSVPQLFLNDKYLSDSDGLYELEDQGKLDQLIVEAK